MTGKVHASVPNPSAGIGSLTKAFEPVSFVTGASGYVGRALMPELRRVEARVQGRCVAHVRPDSPQLDTCRSAFEAIGAGLNTSPWNLKALRASLQELRPSHVFHLVGTTKARASAEATAAPYRSVDQGLFELLLECLQDLESAPRVIYLSSRGASPRSLSAYLRTRHACEQLLISSGLPYTIARPGLITGPDRDPPRRGERLAAAVLGPVAALVDALGLGGSAARLRPFDAAEIAYGLVHAGFNYTTIGRVLEADELRYSQTKDREWSGPPSRRDGPVSYTHLTLPTTPYV